MIKRRVLLSWLGLHDLDAESKGEQGPIASILLNSDAPFDEVRLLVNNWFEQVPRYETWLYGQLARRNRQASISTREVSLASPIDYPGIYEVSRDELAGLSSPQALITINLTSGTPAMIATWLLLGKGVFNSQLVQTSLQSGLQSVELPYDIAVEYLQHQDTSLGVLAAASPGLDYYFEHIQIRSPAMAKAVNLAKKLAPRNLPVIIQGESGTGKEVIAQAIHKASPRANNPFIAVNCGAMPETLVDSQLFGYVKGAFTGATSARKGFFAEADGGTLFLDEVGELPLEAQAKLLRALQQHEINPVGATIPQQVDVRILAATHRDLLQMVEEGRFREDLFYRLAVGIVQLPPLRERTDDIPELVSNLLMRLNDEAKSQPGYVCKTVSESAMDFITQQSWPGNIRELWNTLLRASVWSDDEQLAASHLEQSMIRRPPKGDYRPPNIDVSQGININTLLYNTKRYCIDEALRLTAGQRGKAAKLLGLNNHQTLANWMKQLGMEES